MYTSSAAVVVSEHSAVHRGRVIGTLFHKRFRNLVDMRGIDRSRRRVHVLAPLGRALVNDPMQVALDAVEQHRRVRGPIHVLACEEVPKEVLVPGLVIHTLVLVGEMVCETVKVADRRANLEVLALVLATSALVLVGQVACELFVQVLVARLISGGVKRRRHTSERFAQVCAPEEAVDNALHVLFRLCQSSDCPPLVMLDPATLLGRRSTLGPRWVNRGSGIFGGQPWVPAVN